MININALGDVCPLPVIKAKRALKENKEVLVTVDNEIATQNLSKMGLQLGFQVDVKQEAKGIYQVLFSEIDESDSEKEGLESIKDEIAVSKDSKPYIVVIASRSMGGGNERLGQTLLKAFIYSLNVLDTLPTHLLFYNEGAKLTTNLSPVLEDLNKLKEAGVEILTCGACLDYFDLKGELAVGEITNMYHILELMAKYHAVKP